VIGGIGSSETPFNRDQKEFSNSGILPDLLPFFLVEGVQNTRFSNSA
jgi:hypothetical protein